MEYPKASEAHGGGTAKLEWEMSKAHPVNDNKSHHPIENVVEKHKEKKRYEC